MTRRLLDVLAVLSLLLCAATAGLWLDARVHGTAHTLFLRPIYYPNGGIDGSVEVLSWRDGFHVQAGEERAMAGLGTRFQQWSVPGAELERMSERSWGCNGRVSYGLAAVALGIAPVCRLAWLLRKGRRADGLCAHCGYDLRATPGRCPECGALPTDSMKSDPQIEST